MANPSSIATLLTTLLLSLLLPSMRADAALPEPLANLGDELLGWSAPLFKVAPGSTQPKVYANITVIWTGEAPDPSEVKWFKSLRKKHPQFRLVHMITADYWLAPNQTAIDHLIDLLEPEDEVGVFVTPSPALLKAAGVKVQHSPNIWGHALPTCGNACYTDAHATGYSAETLEKMVSVAVKTLRSKLSKPIRTLMTNDWLMTPHLAKIQKKLDIPYNLNPIPIAALAPLKGLPIYHQLRTRWQEVSPESVVYRLPDSGDDEVIYLPQTAGTLAFSSVTQSKEFLSRIISSQQRGISTYNVFHLSLYHRLLPDYRTRLEQILYGVMKMAEAHQAQILPLPFPLEPLNPIKLAWEG